MLGRKCSPPFDLSALPEPRHFFEGRRRSAEAVPDNIILFRRVRAADLRPFDPQADSFHERWVLLVVLRGRGTVRIDRRPHDLEPGHAVLVPPMHLHGFPAAPSRLDWLFITFEWPGHAGRSTEWRSARALDAGARALLGRLLGEHVAGAASSGNVLAARLLDLLRALYPKNPDTAPPSAGACLLALVQSAAAESPGLRLSGLARRLGQSESHLRSRFRAEAGLSLGRYLRETRLRAAARQLREHGGTVKAAAAAAGYPDPFTFSRVFKRLLGVSPSSVARKG